MQIHEPIIIDIDIKKPTYLNQPQVTQNDSNTFIINIFDDGEPLDLTNVTTVSIAHTRLDRKTIVTNGTKTETNQVKFIVDRPETSLTGRVDAVVQLYNADSRISTLSFSYKVNADPTNNYMPTESEKTLIEVVLGEGPLRIQEAIDATEAANTATTNANTAADNANTQATYATAQGDYAKAQGNEIQGTVNTMNARLDNLVTNTGDSTTEIVDARVGADNVARQNVGNLVREIHGEVISTARQTQTLTHGLNVLNGGVNGPVNLQIEGRTLIPMQNTVLDAAKYYVLADKKTKVKFADATILSGVAKFTARAERPTIIRIANFEGKTSGSTVENPHLFKTKTSTTLDNPSTYSSEFSTANYDFIKSLNGAPYTVTTRTGNGDIAQHITSFNLIEEIERQIGRIPRSTVADKVQWIKDNMAKLTANWHGFGSGPAGNRATLSRWNGTAWVGASVNNTGSVAKTSYLLTGYETIASQIDANGFAHFIAYAEASDGVTASTINTDYVELEIELKPEAILHDPRVPLYEVTQSEYDNILITWNADEVIRRWPMVEGVKHLQNPYVMAEGENLLPPFSKWTLHANAKVISPYELELNATTNTFQQSSVTVPVISNQTYTVSLSPLQNNTRVAGVWYDEKDTLVSYTTELRNSGISIVWVAPSNAKKLRIIIDNLSVIGTFTFKNLILTLGNVAKPFVPRNPSYLFAETTLGAIGTTKDSFFQQDGKYMVRKAVEKDVVLDGTKDWVFYDNRTGLKRIKIAHSSLGTWGTIPGSILSDNQGRILRNNGDTISAGGLYQFTSNEFLTSVSNADSGFVETYTPTNDEIKAYFNGWKVKANDLTTSKPGSWVSIVDGTDAPTQTLDYVKGNKAPNYTPYKLSYVLATPQVSEARVEGAISVNGLTQVEVGSGVIVREKVEPVLNGAGTVYYVNHTSFVNSLAKNKVAKFIQVYKNGVDDSSKWKFHVANTYAHGKDLLEIPKSDFDTTGEFAVTYLVLDRHKFTNNPLNVVGEYANNIRTALDDVVVKQSDIITQQSINIRAIAELYKRVRTLEGV